MIRFDRILCPVDISAFSERALQYAVALARAHRSELTVLSVRPLVLPPALWLEIPTAPLLEPMDVASEENKLRAFVREAAGPAPAKLEVREGSIVSEILSTGRALPADLIVMGTRGRGNLEHRLLGSVTETVVRRASCPVLAVPRLVSEPADPPDPAFRTIVCAIDFSHGSRRTIDCATALAQAARGRLVIVHVLRDLGGGAPTTTAHFDVPEFRRTFEQDARRRIEELVPPPARASCDTHVVIAHGKASDEILRVADAHQADLIVLGIHDRSALDLALFGSTAQHVVHRAHTPVLAVPQEMEAEIAAA